MAAQRQMTFGIVVGNRGFFPDHLAKTGREEIIQVLEAVGAKAIVLGPEYEMSDVSREKFIFTKEKLLEPLPPDVEARLKSKEQK